MDVIGSDGKVKSSASQPLHEALFLRNVAFIGVSPSKFRVRKGVDLSEPTSEAVKPALEEYVGNGWTGKTTGRGGLPA